MPSQIIRPPWEQPPGLARHPPPNTSHSEPWAFQSIQQTSEKELPKRWTKTNAGDTVELAKLGARFSSRIIDTVFFATIIAAVFYILCMISIVVIYHGRWEDIPPFISWVRILLFLLQLLVPVCLLIHGSALVATRKQTIGKRAANIKIVLCDDGLIPENKRLFLRALISFGLLFVQAMCMLFVMIMPNIVPDFMHSIGSRAGTCVVIGLTALIYGIMLLNKNRQAAHDLATKTLLVAEWPHLYQPKPPDNETGTGKIVTRTGIGVQLANRGTRLAARLIDIAIMTSFAITFILISILVILILGSLPFGGFNVGIWVAAVFAFIGAILALYYENSMIANRGQTLGKMLMNIKVVRLEDAGLPGWDKAAARMIVSALLGPFSCLPLIWDGERQALHDMAASTIVVQATPARLKRADTVSSSASQRRFSIRR